MKSLYLDLFFFLNLSADYLICLSAGRICSLRLRRMRYLLASVLGAVYAALSVLPAFAFLSAPCWRLGTALAMGLLAFGREARPLRCMLTMLAVAALFGGALYALMPRPGALRCFSLRKLLAVFFCCYALLKLFFRTRERWDGQRKAQIRLIFQGREAVFPALVDSGNSLRCPDTGERALIVSPAALRPIFLEHSVLLEELTPIDLVEALSQLPAYAGKLRLIPFRSLGGSGLVPVFRPERIWIDGREGAELMVAVSPEARGNGFEAIL